jgi:ubiquinol-cytochrome c reductase cytochrome c subunit
MTNKPETQTPRKRGRRHPLAMAALIIVGLLGTGGAYALATIPATAESSAASADQVAKGQALFSANCATCHGLNLQGTEDGPTLIGVGAASVDFQVGTGRMPLAMTGPQAPSKPPQFTEDQIAALAAYVASVSPGPAIPDDEYLTGEGANLAEGGEIFRINCAMCHNVAGAGGALTEGKYAPPLTGVTPAHIYEAMITGPQNMPVFNNDNITPEEKANVIAYLKYLETTPSVGGASLGSIGPVSEGLFAWIAAIGLIVGITIWLTAKSN